MNKYCVYKHTLPNEKIYIGITSQNPIYRWDNGKGYKGQFFYNAIKKYGWDNIKHEILFSDLSKEEAELKEIELIKLYKSNQREFGYNVDNGGNCCGTHSEETRLKMSKTRKGLLHSEEHKKAISLSHIGIKHTEKSKQKMSETRKGKPMSENTRNALLKANVGRKNNKETLLKMRNATRNRVIAINQYDLENNFIKQWDFMIDIQREFGFSVSNICKCCKGQIKTAYGYVWKYAE